MSSTTTIQEQKDARLRGMREIKVGKVVINIGVGRSGEAIERARRVIEDLVHQKASSRKAKKSIRDFGVRKGEPIGMMVTLRGSGAIEVLKLLFKAREDKVPATAFDDFGNCSFGIKEHIEIPGVRYSPDIGIFGMNVSAVLERPGYRVAKRSRATGKVGKFHRVGREDAIAYLKQNFGIEVM
ncbi:MAG: 50S ribosomal protein L5 [Nitrososphaerales archaeon]